MVTKHDFDNIWRKILGLPTKEDRQRVLNKPTPTVEIRCKSKEEAIELADRIDKSGVLREEQRVVVYTDMYFCD
jgi:hypothetical protein